MEPRRSRALPRPWAKVCARGFSLFCGEVNRAGGVAGRQLELKSVDDGYEPQKTIEAMKKMLAEEKVFAIVGAVGTPTSNAGQPIATEAKVPFIGPFNGRRVPAHPLQTICRQYS